MTDLALFDFDGTITSEDTFKAFIYFAVDPKRLRWGGVILSPLIAAYRLGIVHASVVRRGIVGIGFRGKSKSEFQVLGGNFARLRIPEVVRPNAIERILWHKQRGDVVVVVSSSLDLYLSVWCAQQGVKLVCNELAAVNDTLTGRYHLGDCTGSEKARRVRERFDVKAFTQIYAYGDTTEDLELLNLAHKKYFRWQDVSDPSIAAEVIAGGAAHPSTASRQKELRQENSRLERLIAEQAHE